MKKYPISEELYALVRKAYMEVLTSIDAIIADEVHNFKELGMTQRKAEDKLLSYYQDIMLSDRSSEMAIIHKCKTLMSDFGDRIDDEDQAEISIRNLTNALFRHDADLSAKFKTADKFVNYLYRKLLIREAIERLKPAEKLSMTPKNFASIFTIEDFDKYIYVLTECLPPLLTKEGERYKFVGSKNTHTGCVGQWFNALKERGIISSKTSRSVIADVLNNEIEDFYISHATIDNASTKYRKVFEKQLMAVFQKD